MAQESAPDTSDFARLSATMERRPDGSIVVRCDEALGAYPQRITDRLVHWAATAADRTLFAQRDADGRDWERLSYGEALASARSIGAALHQRGLTAERPLVILSGNDLDHARVALGALYAGIPYAPVSPAYSTVSGDFSALRHIIGLLTPGLVFVSDAARFSRALLEAIPPDVEVVVAANPPRGRAVTPLAELRAGTAGIDAVHAAVGPDTVAKFLFTSGSTGLPKAVVNTQRMICSNQEMIGAMFRYFRTVPPVLLDWTPWHHTAGGNSAFHEVIYNGGTMYIDGGRPLPDQIYVSLRNLKDVSPNTYFNVPVGYAALLPHLRDDAELRRAFFRDLRTLTYAGAGLPQYVWDELQAFSRAERGRETVIVTGYGSTETAPAALNSTPDMRGAGTVGLPIPGVTLKLVPNGEKLEARLKGPNVTPGYWRDAKATADAFDEEGFFRIGDAMRFNDPDDISRGLAFDGRLGENFKLATGTWVHVGALRARVLEALGPIARDVVVAGLDRTEVGGLVFPDIDACRALAGAAAGSAAEVVAHPAVRQAFAERLRAHARGSTGSAGTMTRIALLAEPPSLDRGETTDKGSINQRAVLRNRAADVERLYAEPGDAIRAAPGQGGTNGKAA